jgi:prolyl 4-hydroxylase
MDALREVDLGGEKSFIGAWYLSDLTLCDELIAYFKHCKGNPGQIGRQSRVEPGQIGHDRKVVPEIKDSLDLISEGQDLAHPVFKKYLYGLNEITRKYIEKYEAAGAVNAWGIREPINIQYYKPTGGYKIWHTERVGKLAPSINRHLAFMTYLNDVFDEGGTEFYYQKIKTEARKGLTLIWPTDWTHLHRGVVSPTQEKYIITGWFSFL